METKGKLIKNAILAYEKNLADKTITYQEENGEIHKIYFGRKNAPHLIGYDNKNPMYAKMFYKKVVLNKKINMTNLIFSEHYKIKCKLICELKYDIGDEVNIYINIKTKIPYSIGLKKDLAVIIQNKKGVPVSLNKYNLKQFKNKKVNAGKILLIEKGNNTSKK